MKENKSRKVRLVLRPEDMRIFVAIGSAQTLTEAAQQLGMPLFTISRALKRIEETAHVVLVRRGGASLQLTALGQDYLDACLHALEAHQSAVDVLLTKHTEPIGTLHVAAPVAFSQSVLAHILPSFLHAYPQITVDLYTFSDQMQSPKTSNDIFLNVGAPTDSRYLFKMFPLIRQGLFATPEYLGKRPVPTHPLDLEKHSCLGIAPGDTRSSWQLSQSGERVSIHPEGRVCLTDPVTLSHLALASAGVTVLPVWLAREYVSKGDLVEVLPGWALESAIFCALYRDRLHPTSKEGAFLSFLSSILGKSNDPRCKGGDPREFFVSQLAGKNNAGGVVGRLKPVSDPPLHGAMSAS